MAFKHHKTKSRIVMAGAIVIALFITTYGGPLVFLANSPRLNPQFIAALTSAPTQTLALLRNPFDSEERRNDVETVALDTGERREDLSYTPIAKGVHAAEDPATGTAYVEIAEGTQLEVHELTLSDGRTVKVYVPIEE